MKSIYHLFFCLFLSVSTLYGQCQFVFVSTTGSPTAAGTQQDPLDINTAFLTTADNGYIRLATGTYNIDNSLTLNGNNIIVEGGFIAAQAWTKTSLAGATTIYRSALNVQGPIIAPRLSVFEILGKNDFRFQDITIQVSNAPQATLTSPYGTSVYGVYLYSCSNYKWVRCSFIIGSASNGLSGTPGLTGLAGSNGALGSAGSCDGGTCTFSSGQAGGAGGVGGAGGGGTSGGAGGSATLGQQNNGVGGSAGTGRNGGGGGGGGAGGDECSTNNAGLSGTGGASSCSVGAQGGARGLDGDPGGDGNPGTSGANGTNGINGIDGNLGFDLGVFWTPGSQGTAGTDACGGAGGGAGGGGGRQVCSLCDNGPGNGGSGGGGGGQGGQGGQGGYGDGSAFGIYLTQNGNNGQVIDCNILTGTLGLGGIGSPGGLGGAGGLGGSQQTTCNAQIGEGGSGGSGGAGGVGGKGGNGMDGISANVYVASGAALTSSIINFNLLLQPEIQASYATCTNTIIQVTDITIPTGVSDWTFTTVATFQTASANPAQTSPNAIGYTSVTHANSVYTDFINITCQSDVLTLNQNICFGDSVLLGGLYYAADGTYTYYGINSQGCDSIVTLNLSVETVNNTITANGLLLSANQSGLIYQWINCSNNTNISGANLGSYTVSQNGTYAVISTNTNGCSDTSNCITINFIGLEEMGISAFSVSPNPVSSQLTFRSILNFMGTVYLSDINGRIIQQIEIENQMEKTIDFPFPAGVYFVKIMSVGHEETLKLLKM